MAGVLVRVIRLCFWTEAQLFPEVRAGTCVRANAGVMERSRQLPP